MKIAAALTLASVAAALYGLATALQALEARRAPESSALRASLLLGLARRWRWVVGGLVGLAAFPLQAIALSLASLSVVQPTLALALVVLLALGARTLHERVGAREVAGVAAIVAGVVGASVFGPGAASRVPHSTTAHVVVLGTLALLALGPYALRAARRSDGLATSVLAGLAWAWFGFGAVLLDGAIAHRAVGPGAVWLAAVAVAAWSALLAETTALQTWPATRAIPVVFALEILVPAAAAPFLPGGAISPAHAAGLATALALAAAGAALLGGSRTVATLTAP